MGDSVLSSDSVNRFKAYVSLASARSLWIFARNWDLSTSKVEFTCETASPVPSPSLPASSKVMSEGNTSLPKAEVPPQVPVPKIAAANVAKPVDSATLKALEHTGLPPSLLRWKPRLPSRNWSIFLTLVGGISYAYYYDRSECKRLKQEYTDKVKHLSEEPIEGGALGHGRKVTIYASKWPDDDEWERGLQYFKRYIKVSPYHLLS
jgi:import inner membrane translocase subunit TIM54